ncbi:hypothetical protein C8R45DRAFT_1135158 [Mycena sanguinolenta]|nr:hypothetical protein C8R45DRAFT_1135158 [Mycena sanguinolenta]
MLHTTSAATQQDVHGSYLSYKSSRESARRAIGNPVNQTHLSRTSHSSNQTSTMKFTLLSATMLACINTVFGHTFLADSPWCTPGQNYCGSTLKAIQGNPVGWYYGAVEQATYDSNIPDPRDSAPDVLFHCTTDYAFLKVLNNCGREGPERCLVGCGSDVAKD